MNGRALAVVVR